MKKTTSVIGLPTHPDLVERAAQLLGICGEAGLVFGEVRELPSPKGTLLGNRIDLGPDRHILYGMCTYGQDDTKPDVRLVVSEGREKCPGFILLAVVCIAAENRWNFFARLVDGERSDEMKTLCLRLGIKGVQPDGATLSSQEALERVRTIAEWSAKLQGKGG